MYEKIESGKRSTELSVYNIKQAGDYVLPQEQELIPEY